MKFFKDLSIKRKMTWIIMLTSSIALLLACAAFVTYELVTSPRNLVQELTTLADVTAKGCAFAVSFNAPGMAEDAEKTLANLGGGPIVAACIYKDGKVWARYPKTLPDSAFPKPPSSAGHRFEKNSLFLFREIHD